MAIVVALGLVLGAGAAVAAANCNVFQLDFEVADNLRDGDHALGSMAMPGGRLVASVTVKDKVAGDPWLTLNGRKLRTIPEASVPRAALACLKEAARSPSTGPAQLDDREAPTTMAEIGYGWGFPETMADARCRTTVKCVDAVGGGGYCSARMVCGGRVYFGFSTY